MAELDAEMVVPTTVTLNTFGCPNMHGVVAFGHMIRQGALNRLTITDVLRRFAILKPGKLNGPDRPSDGVIDGGTDNGMERRKA